MKNLKVCRFIWLCWEYGRNTKDFLESEAVVASCVSGWLQGCSCLGRCRELCGTRMAEPLGSMSTSRFPFGISHKGNHWSRTVWASRYHCRILPPLSGNMCSVFFQLELDSDQLCLQYGLRSSPEMFHLQSWVFLHVFVRLRRIVC